MKSGRSRTAEAVQFRILLLLGTVLYPLWWLPFKFIVRDVQESLVGRALVGGLCLVIFLLSFKSRWIKRNLGGLFTLAMVVLTSHYFFLAYENHLHVAYGVGAFIVLSAIVAGFNSLTTLGIYSLTSILSASLLTVLVKTEFPKEIFYFGILTTLFVSIIAQMNRLKVIQDLEKTQVYLKETQRIAHVGTCDLDVVTGEKLWSDEAIRIYELDPKAELPSVEEIYKMVHPDDVAQLKNEYQKAVTEGISYAADRRVLTKKGLKYIYVKSVPEKDSKGKVRRVHGVVMDLTERKRSELSAAQSFKMASLGEMAGGVAHEINNPLAVIKLMAGRLVDNLNSSSPDLEFLKGTSLKIDVTSDRIARIVSGLRHFCEDGSKVPFSPTSIQKICEETLLFCGEKMKNAGIKFNLAEIPPGVTAECRPTEISQILLNLVNNSVDVISSNPEKWITLSFKEFDKEVEIRVTDSGKGISEEVESKIFQPFFTTKEIGKGTGLGLSVSLGIAKSHNGTLFLDRNSPNTCFVLRLPKRQIQHSQVA